ncbi:MAG TPA: type VI secretion system baseplate subunit TssG [Xanthobacteraceae bacterium]|nr:type VI secretion system baseplate subunit TssG [Xanthobacteraceae bacterium]
MNRLDDIKQEPWRFDFFAVLRRLERTFPDRPRIGDSSATRQEYLMLGQEPFMDFPASNLASAEQRPDGRVRVLAKFLGLLGPQGALPLATTEEVHAWTLMRDDAFPRFLDLLNNRFLQLFFRAWADARPVAQRDRPKEDRFAAYVGSMIGLGSTIYQGLDRVPDTGKLGFAGLIAAQAKSSSRLRSLIAGLFGVKVEIDELVGTHLKLDAADRTRLGQANSALGSDILVGASIFSVQDKIRIRIFARNLREYTQFLPTGSRSEPLVDLVYFYIGDELEWEVELAIPTRETAPVQLSKFGQLGWTTWIGTDRSPGAPAYRCDARFHPAERMRQRRQEAA